MKNKFFYICFIIFIFFINVHVFAANINTQSIDFFNPGKQSVNAEPNNTSLYIKAKPTSSIFASFNKEIQNSAYVKQLIPLEIKATVLHEFNYIQITSTNKHAGIIYDLNSSWIRLDENSYTKTFYFQAKEPIEKIPSLKVELYGDNGLIETTYLPPQTINIIKISDDEGKFINVFSESLNIKKYKTSRYDDNSLIMVIEFFSHYSNLNDIHFNRVDKQGIDSKSGVFPDESLFYFIIFNDNIKNIEFSYFNLKDNRFKTIKLPVNISEDDLSTQIGLNPKKSVYEFYKEVTAGVFAFVFLLIFIFRKHWVYIFIALLFASYLVYNKISFAEVIIKNNTNVRILPTKKSTIFYTTSSQIEVEKLNTKETYVKVLLPNGKIGWVKQDDIVKN